MIREAFGLTHLPFEPLRSALDLYASRQVLEVRTRLERLLDHGGIGLLAGDTGSGKSSIALAWRLQLPANRFFAETLSLPAANPRGLVRELARRLAITPLPLHCAGYPRSGCARGPYHFESLLPQVTRTLQEVREQDKRQPVLLVEEAHVLPLAALETLRYLAGPPCAPRSGAMQGELRPDGRPLLTLLLVGHRDLLAVLRQRVATAFRQRLLFTYLLTGLGRDEIGPYLEHHLRRVDARRSPFTDDAVAALFNHSQGYPRVINTLATDALYAAAERRLTTIDPELIEAVVAAREELL